MSMPLMMVLRQAHLTPDEQAKAHKITAANFKQAGR